jgi:hypothetical protein
MMYVVKAWRAEPGTGPFEAEAETKEDAIEKARDLRGQGLQVKIFRPDGEPINEVGAD